MRWLCVIGRIDILTETSLLLTYPLAPCIRHLHQSLYVFKYLKYHKRYKCVFYLNYVDITYNQIKVEYRAIYGAKFMNELYPDTVEDLTPSEPNPKERAVQIPCFVDADHGGDQTTQIPRTGILTFLNKYPIMW